MVTEYTINFGRELELGVLVRKITTHAGIERCSVKRKEVLSFGNNTETVYIREEGRTPIMIGYNPMRVHFSPEKETASTYTVSGDIIDSQTGEKRHCHEGMAFVGMKA